MTARPEVLAVAHQHLPSSSRRRNAVDDHAANSGRFVHLFFCEQAKGRVSQDRVFHCLLFPSLPRLRMKIATQMLLQKNFNFLRLPASLPSLLRSLNAGDGNAAGSDASFGFVCVQASGMDTREHFITVVCCSVPHTS